MSDKTSRRNDEPFVSDGFGTGVIVVRKDTAAALAGTDGDYTFLIVDSTGRLHMAGEITSALPAGDNNIGNVDIVSMPTVATSIKVSPVGGTKAVAAAGTGVPLVATSTDAQVLFVQAKTGNTGAIYFGDSNVDKDSSTQVTLLQSQTWSIGVDGGFKLDVNEHWIDADNNDDGVDFVYYG